MTILGLFTFVSFLVALYYVQQVTTGNCGFKGLSRFEVWLFEQSIPLSWGGTTLFLVAVLVLSSLAQSLWTPLFALLPAGLLAYCVSRLHKHGCWPF